MELIDVYEKLAKKYDLPSYDIMNDEFEISSIEHTDFLLREVSHKIIERIDEYLKLLDDILQPEANLTSLRETKYFTDQEKITTYNIFKKLMIIKRKYQLNSINNNEEEIAKFIINSIESWSKVKQELKDTIKKLKDSWSNESDKEEDLGYLG